MNKRWFLACCTLVALGVGGMMVRGAAGQTSAPPAPVTVSRGSFPITVPAGEYDLITVVAKLPPNGAVPWHYHSGPVVGTVISGEAVLLTREGGEKTFKAGESWIERPKEVGEMINRSSDYAYVAASYLVPKGAPPLTFVK